MHADNELQQQTRLLEAVRGILTPSVQAGLGPEQQAFLQYAASWQPPMSSSGTNKATGSGSECFAHAECMSCRPATRYSTCYIVLTCMSNHAGSASRQSTATDAVALAQASPSGSTAEADAASNARSNAQPPADATPWHQETDDRAAADTESHAADAARQSQQGGQDRRNSQPASGSSRHEASGGSSSNAEGSRRRRGRRPAITPLETMALGSLLQSTLQADAYRDPASILSNPTQQ